MGVIEWFEQKFGNQKLVPMISKLILSMGIYSKRMEGKGEM